MKRPASSVAGSSPSREFQSTPYSTAYVPRRHRLSLSLSLSLADVVAPDIPQGKKRRLRQGPKAQQGRRSNTSARSSVNGKAFFKPREHPHPRRAYWLSKKYTRLTMPPPPDCVQRHRHRSQASGGLEFRSTRIVALGQAHLAPDQDTISLDFCASLPAWTCVSASLPTTDIPMMH